MSKETLKQYGEKIAKDPELVEKVKAFENEEQVIGHAKSLGFEIEVADFEQLKEDQLKEGVELSEDQLEQVAGGFFWLACFWG